MHAIECTFDGDFCREMIFVFGTVIEEQLSKSLEEATQFETKYQQLFCVYTL